MASSPITSWQVAVVQLLSCVLLFVTPWVPGFLVFHHILELDQIHVHWVGDVTQASGPLSSTSLPAFSLSQHQGLSNASTPHIRWPKHWSFSFSISPTDEYSGLISFMIDWLDLLVCQGTLKSSPTPQSKSINSSALSSNSHLPTLLLEKP